MRPQGEIRAALMQAAEALGPEPTQGTWRELAEHAQVGYTFARNTIMNMARAGELEPTGAKKVPGSKRPMTIFKPKGKASGWVQGPLVIDGVMRSWSRG